MNVAVGVTGWKGRGGVNLHPRPPSAVALKIISSGYKLVQSAILIQNNTWAGYREAQELFLIIGLEIQTENRPIISDWEFLSLDQESFLV